MDEVVNSIPISLRRDAVGVEERLGLAAAFSSSSLVVLCDTHKEGTQGGRKLCTALCKGSHRGARLLLSEEVIDTCYNVRHVAECLWGGLGPGQPVVSI